MYNIFFIKWINNVLIRFSALIQASFAKKKSFGRFEVAWDSKQFPWSSWFEQSIFSSAFLSYADCWVKSLPSHFGAEQNPSQHRAAISA